MSAIIEAPAIFADFASVGLKTHKFGSTANALAKWYTPPGVTSSGSVFKNQASI